MRFWRGRASRVWAAPMTPVEQEAHEETRRHNAEYLLEEWREKHPVRLWRVYYVRADGTTSSYPGEKVQAHRWVVEGLQGAPDKAVFMFLSVEPVSDGWTVEEKATAILTIPFDRVHSINLSPASKGEADL